MSQSKEIYHTLQMTYIESLYQQYKSDPQSVSSTWRAFFKEREVTQQQSLNHSADCPVADPGIHNAQITELIHRYRDLGHLLACMDPLSACPTDHPLLRWQSFGFDKDDLVKEFPTPQFSFVDRAPLKKIIKILKQTYCRSIGVEYMHLQDPFERQWVQERMESTGNQPDLTPDQQRRILEKLIQAAIFEQFLNKKYLAVTRFSLEGGDGLIPMFDALLERAATLGTREIVFGMAHRGRLNIQANILQKPLMEIFAEFESCYDPDQITGSGDVKYHNGYLTNLDLGTPGTLQALLVPNPSHLEAVNPVVIGLARARQQICGKSGKQEVMPILIHGDAAFAGQGIVAETLNMSQLDGYSNGGTIHIVINNQIGYTTLPQDARSTRYSTDVAKMLMVPIFHVHGENPESLVHIARLAVEYRHTFGKDVVIDLICYRRFGHNEGDEPYFTQPLMYDRIRQRPSPHQLYAQELISAGVVTSKETTAIETAMTGRLETAYSEVRNGTCPLPQSRFYESWEAYQDRYDHAPIDTSVNRQTLIHLAQQLNQVPEHFQPHSKIKTLLRRRLEAFTKDRGIDWANAETLAFASLLNQGIPIRLSGQDSGRGTFSQRHSVLFDRKTGAPYIPLNHLNHQQAPFEVHNSLLAEAGVLGFEYGFALARPDSLTLWEAQFGDFINNAQAVIDLFIASGQTKWQRLCGLVLLLPHGWEGLGPEHSSARLERFLQLCAEDNIQVCNLTTPAQYFHLLRRQILAPYRKPLILMTPKSLLRHPRAISTLEAFTHQTFAPVLDDPEKPDQPNRILICSGKIYYQLLHRRAELDNQRIAIIRLEQFYPFPQNQLHTILKQYPKSDTWIWVQEAPQNMGGWQFVKPRLEALIGQPLQYAGRPPAASPATGYPHIFKQEQTRIIDQAMGPLEGGSSDSGKESLGLSKK